MIYIFCTVFIAVIAVVCINVFKLPTIGKLFLVIFSISTVFYGIAGTAYWFYAENGIFLDVDWMPDLVESVKDYVVVYIIVVLTFSFAGGGGDWRGSKVGVVQGMSFVEKLFLFLTICSAIYTIQVGSSLISSGASLMQDPLVLIMYQFSDIGIGLILYKMAESERNKNWVVAAIGYSIYAFLVGFRYRLLLLWGPVLVSWFMLSALPKSKKIIIGSVSFFSVIILFSVMTLSRSKFGGIDVEKLDGIDSGSALYGLFADTNIVFGWLSAKSIFGKSVEFVGATPFLEIFVQFIPRFIYPGKSLYQHLWDVNYGLGGTLQALMSGTAMPFFGEYYAAGGWGWLVFGVVVYALFVCLLMYLIVIFSNSYQSYIYGSSLVVIYFGYYYYSRGSVAQIFKGALFTVGVYIYLQFSGRKRIKFN